MTDEIARNRNYKRKPVECFGDIDPSSSLTQVDV
jgi:hypothetical protein